MYRRSITYRLIAGFMALWMLVVSMGATVDMHFCRGHLVDYKIWGKARTCGMKEDASACSHSSQGISHPKCCDQATHQLYFDQNQHRVHLWRYYVFLLITVVIIIYIGVFTRKKLNEFKKLEEKDEECEIYEYKS